jgi:small-conductance mechanosensitive channel
MYPTLARNIRAHAAKRARAAKREAILLIPLIIGVLLVYRYREQLFGLDTPIRVASVLALVILGWTLARDLGRAIGPTLFRRMDAANAGTVGFLIRLTTLALTVLTALRLAGLDPRTMALGGAVTAVILGLAAQQTIGNLIAGVVLLSARPFRVGERVRLQGGPLAGQTEGTVTSLGLLYTTFAQGEDTAMIPNSVVLACAVVPLREPAHADLLAHLVPDAKPTQVHALLAKEVTVPIRGEPHIGLEEIDSDEVVMRIEATPQMHADGPRLADELLAALAPLTRKRGSQNKSEASGNGSGQADQPTQPGVRRVS